jgi:hypothetical protein
MACFTERSPPLAFCQPSNRSGFTIKSSWATTRPSKAIRASGLTSRPGTTVRQEEVHVRLLFVVTCEPVANPCYGTEHIQHVPTRQCIRKVQRLLHAEH